MSVVNLNFNQVAISEGGVGGDEVYPLGEVLTSDTLLVMHELDRRKTCQWIRNLLHEEGVPVSISILLASLFRAMLLAS